jgi:CheY-like chemotaxis protein
MSRARVLLVDDEPELIFTLAERLELRGFEVDAVTSGEEALKRVEEHDYRVAVVDVKMPGLDGHQVLETIKARFPDISVILLTGHGGDEEGERGMRLGACAYLFKPVNIADLIETMRDCAGGFDDE